MNARPIVTITPGPTLTVYENGKPVVSVELTALETLNMIEKLAKEMKP